MQELDEIFIRNEIRKILSEQGDISFGDIMPPSADEFYDTFIGPFVDVFKVAQVAVKDVASATLTTIQSAITFDTKKQQDLLGKFRDDRKKYKSEMDKAMESTNKALSSPDAQLLMFMMNPGAYLGAGLAREVAETAEPATDFIKGKLGFIGRGMGFAGAAKATDDKGPLRGIMDDMKKLFFGHTSEGMDEIDELELILFEADEEEKKKEKLSDAEIQEEIDDWLTDSGASDKIEGYAKNIIDKKKAEVAEVKAQQMALIDGLNAISKAQSFEELAKLIPELTAVGVDLSDQAAAVEKAAQDQKDILTAGDEEAEKMIEDLKKTPDGKAIPDDAKAEDWFPLINQGVIAAAFGEVVNTAKSQSLGELIGFVAEMTRSELDDLARTGSMGKEYADLIFGLEQDLLSM